jgi:hypothetical protein
MAAAQSKDGAPYDDLHAIFAFHRENASSFEVQPHPYLDASIWASHAKAKLYLDNFPCVYKLYLPVQDLEQANWGGKQTKVEEANSAVLMAGALSINTSSHSDCPSL